jgi:hypothetical protein
MRMIVLGLVLLTWSVPSVVLGADRVRLQLMTFEVPVEVPANTRSREATVVAYMDLPDASQVAYLCHMSPRLLDAFQDVFYDRYIKVNADRTLGVEAVEPLLVIAARDATRLPAIQRVILAHGTRDRVANARGTSIRCADQ